MEQLWLFILPVYSISGYIYVTGEFWYVNSLPLIKLRYLPSHMARKFSVNIGTVFPNKPITTFPIDTISCFENSKKTVWVTWSNGALTGNENTCF